MEPVAFDSHDVDELEALAGRLLAPMRLRPVGTRTRIRMTRRVLTPQVALDDLECGFDLGFDADPQRYLILSHVVSASVRLHRPHGVDVFGPGASFLLCRPGLPYAGTVHAAALRHLALDPALLGQVAGSDAGHGPAVRLTDHRPVSRQAARGLDRAVEHVRGLLTDPDGPPSPLVAAAAGRYLAAHLLDAFPSNAVQTTSAVDRQDARPVTVRRAVALIETHPDRDLTLGDIAAAAYVTPRALQLAFRRHLDTTPMAYLRRVRLDHAHADLSRATPGDGTTVTSVAARWAFSGSSRFAVVYRSAYGCHPSATLSTAR